MDTALIHVYIVLDMFLQLIWKYAKFCRTVAICKGSKLQSTMNKGTMSSY